MIWLRLALDPATKLIHALVLGARTQQTAHTVVNALRATLASTCVPLVTTDGLRHCYYYALTAHLGRWLGMGRRRHWQVDPHLLYGQVQQRYHHRRLARRATGSVWVGRAAARVRRALGWRGLVQTALVERLNLAARQSVAALTRRTWATAQTAAGLGAQVAWWRGCYHFVRPHLRLQRLARGCTPAMAAGRTTRRWTVGEFLSAPGARAR